MFGLLAKESAAPWRGWVARYWPWLAVGLTLLLVVTIRVRLRDMPLERDEGEYAYMGQLMLQGVPPYKEACNMKLPGTYAAYALSMAVFGQTPAGIRLGLMLVNGGAIVLLFLLGRKLLDNTAGVVAAACYALLSLSPSVVGTSAHATQFIVLPALGGTLLLVKGMQKAEGRRQKSEGRALAPSGPPVYQLSTINYQLLCSGLLFGLAFLMKQHGILFGFFGALYLVGVWLAQWFQARAELDSLPGRRPLQRPKTAHGRHSHVASTPAPAPAPPTLRLSHFAAGKLAQQAAPVEPQVSADQTATVPDAPDAPRSTLHAPPSAPAAPSPLHPPPSFSALLLNLTVFGAGLLLPYLFTCLVLWWTGVLPEFVFWTISYARKYTELVTAARGLDIFRRMLVAAVGYNFLLWLLPWIGVLMMWWDERLTPRSGQSPGNREPRRPHGLGAALKQKLVIRPPKPAIVARGTRRDLGSPEPQKAPDPAAAARPEAGPRSHSALRPPHSAFPCPRLFLVLFLLCSFGSVSIGLYFRLHYFVTLLPALALLSGVAVSRSLWVARQEPTLELFLAGPVLLLCVLGVGWALVGNGSVWFTMSPTLAAREVYGTTAFTEAAKLAGSLQTNTPANARIAILGSEPEVFFYAHRRSASKYLYVYPLMERQPFAKQMQEEMLREIERAQPEYVLYADDALSWLRRADSEPLLDNWWPQYRAANLELVQTVPIDIGRLPETLSGVSDRPQEDTQAAAADLPTTGQWLLYKRRAGTR